MERAMKSTPKKVAQRLYEIAEQQQGFFTAKQAKNAGYLEETHVYHVRAGNWIREHRGIYRLAQFPATERPDLALWHLWSCNRDEIPQGIYSHQTALSIYELTDINPSALHMTVPRGFRRRAPIPGVLSLHFGDIPDGDMETMQGFRVTKPLRTIRDLIADRVLSDDQILQALQEAMAKGLITIRDIERLVGRLDDRNPFEALVGNFAVWAGEAGRPRKRKTHVEEQPVEKDVAHYALKVSADGARFEAGPAKEIRRIRWIFELYVFKRFRDLDIAITLNFVAREAGFLWTLERLREVLTNKNYIRVKDSRGERIIDPVTFYLASRILNGLDEELDEDLQAGLPPEWALTPKEHKRFEDNLEKMREHIKPYEKQYRALIIELARVRGYLGRLLGNENVVKYMEKNQPDILDAFRNILDEPAMI